MVRCSTCLTYVLVLSLMLNVASAAAVVASKTINLLPDSTIANAKSSISSVSANTIKAAQTNKSAVIVSNATNGTITNAIIGKNNSISGTNNTI